MELVIVFVLLILMWIFSKYYCETRRLERIERRIRELEKELSKYKRNR